MLIFIKISLSILLLNGLCQLIAAGTVTEDIYTSTASLYYVLQVESMLIENLEHYIKKSQEDIESVKRIIENFYSTGFRSKPQIPKRAKSILKNTANYLQKYKLIHTVYEAYIPTQKDLKGMIVGLVRLQRIYGFTAKQIADDTISEKIKLGDKLTAEDCLYIAFQLSELKMHEFATEWYEATAERLNRTEIRFFKLTDRINEEIIQTLQDYYKYEKLDDLTEVDKNVGIGDLEMVQRACGEDILKTPESLSKLYCKYETENHPFLKLAPIKVEVMNIIPYLVVFHDVIYDSEIKIIKDMSLDLLERAETWSVEDDKDAPTNFRVSKHAWIGNESHPVMHILNQRTYDMTGLTMETSEPLQVVNYGIGGHYDFHYDYSEETDDPNYSSALTDTEYGTGDRLATVLFYLSEVPLGGTTVFPYMNTRIFPEKGSAVFWYNLHTSLKGDTYTLHSACPVIVGTKWAANKWIRSEGQIFRRPCLNKLDHDDLF